MSPTAPVREERRKEDLDAEDVPDPAEEETQDVPPDPVDAPEEAPEVEKKKRKEMKMSSLPQLIATERRMCSAAESRPVKHDARVNNSDKNV